MDWGSEKVVLHPLQVLQPAVQLSALNGTLGPGCALGASGAGYNLPLGY